MLRLTEIYTLYAPSYLSTMHTVMQNGF